ncbi:hypothetical protein LCM14_23510 [Priestia aryabhattai]|uniref:M43 family zinc metalloprotease n=1 Tax=Priestia aryabhattai TaxID=412384 RepID=UPI001CD5D85D|nr:M43 family zinc metalloprotease [Priestia aryabhattai]MCA1052793.1 hypothetical protein [Priestia aryabhattai]
MTKKCDTMDFHNWLLSQSREYAEERNKIEKFTAEYTMNNHLISDRNIITIPIVVHIVHQNPAIVTDAQVQSQINVLNLDYRARNADLVNVPSYWKGVIGDARIEFTLEAITRTTTTIASFQSNNLQDVKTIAAPRPTNQFLNIWLCEISGSDLLGRTTFPGVPPGIIDGIIIKHSAFGTTGSATFPNDAGRTATHEIAHWLNVYHLWGNHHPDQVDCNDTDFVDDTPTQGMANYHSPTGPQVSCSNGPNGDMYMNFMDYTDDRSMYMFTQAQVKRMNACLIGPRSSFLRYQNPPFTGNISGSSMFIQSDRGSKGNFELVVPLSTGGITYFSRDNDDSSPQWKSPDPGNIIHDTKGKKYKCTKLIQSNYDNPGNLEVIALDDRGHLSYITRNFNTNKWSDIISLELYDVNKVKLSFRGHHAFIQSRFGDTRGNFELVAPLSRQGLAYFSRNNDNQAPSWSEGIILGTELGEVDAVGLIQSNYGNPGNLEIVVLHDTGKKLAYMSRDSNTGIWSEPTTLEFCEPPTNSSQLFFRGNPVLLQSQFGTKGNFELIIPLSSGGLAHFIRNNDEPHPCWSKGTIFGTELGEVDAVGLIQSNYGTLGRLEIVALHDNGTQLTHMYNDLNTGIWSHGDTIIKKQ